MASSRAWLAVAVAAALVATLLGAGRASAQAGLLVPTSTGTQDPKVLSLREMRVDVGIARGYTRVNAVQIFENHTGSVQEGTYRFALPPSAAVGDFAIWDGVVRIPGVILEKRRARAIYRDLTTQRIDPGLLQQGEEEDEGEPEPGGTSGSRRPSGGALFSVTVAPIPPHATKRLELQFQQELPFTESEGELRIALAPPDGEPLIAGSFEVHVTGDPSEVALAALPTALPLTAGGNAATLAFSGRAVRLDRDLAIGIRPAPSAALRVSAFRNPEGALPDGIALAPWERRDEIPPEKDGFFLFEMLPPAAAEPPSAGSTPAGTAATASARRPPVAVAIAFDTSFSHRWSGLERGYAHLVRVLRALGPEDRFALISFDAEPRVGAALGAATPAAVEAALTALREQALGFGSDVPAGLAAAARALGGVAGGRVLLISDGPPEPGSQELTAALDGVPLFADLTGVEAPEAYRAAALGYLVGGAADLETELFERRVLEPIETRDERRPAASSDDQPFVVSGGNPALRDVYPVLIQPPEPGSLSGWVGRYAAPAAKLTFRVDSPLLPEAARAVTTDLPERALEARDLPRRWARARVDYLLDRIEREGERREWVEEIVALSKRYKFVTPYTAFLAAPRSLLRPRRIQPGDPVLRVECDESTVAATALLPFGERLPLVRRPESNLWEGRFLVPEGLADGRYAIRIVLTDASGARVTEAKHFVLDGTAPTIAPQDVSRARAGERLRVAARTDSDVVFLSARIADAAPVPLRWDATSKASVGELIVPTSARGATPLFFEAVDGAKNRGFARASVEVLP
ncbi:MAG: VIT domain-containing protein [bacterium]